MIIVLLIITLLLGHTALILRTISPSNRFTVETFTNLLHIAKTRAGGSIRTRKGSDTDNETKQLRMAQRMLRLL